MSCGTTSCWNDGLPHGQPSPAKSKEAELSFSYPRGLTLDQQLQTVAVGELVWLVRRLFSGNSRVTELHDGNTPDGKACYRQTYRHRCQDFNGCGWTT